MRATLHQECAHRRTLRTWMRGVAGKAYPVPHLSHLREAAFLSQYELAQRAQVARSTIARLERGEDARRGTIRRLADALGVTPRQLTGEP